jgi:hypothetical protein
MTEKEKALKKIEDEAAENIPTVWINHFDRKMRKLVLWVAAGAAVVLLVMAPMRPAEKTCHRRIGPNGMVPALGCGGDQGVS